LVVDESLAEAHDFVLGVPDRLVSDTDLEVELRTTRLFESLFDLGWCRANGARPA
jgi:hypothetical protein